MSDLTEVLEGESEEAEPEKTSETPEGEGGKPESETKDTKGEEEEAGNESEEGEKPDEDEKPDESSKEDEPPSSKDTQESDKSVPVSALQDERRKRQELERQMQELRSQIQNPTAQQKQDFWDDPEGYIQQIQGQTQEQLVNHKLQMSEQMARDLWEDFDEKVDTFKELIDQRPYLRQEMLDAAHPAKFVYETAKEHLDLKEIGDVRKYKETLEADFERRVKEEAEKLRAKALEEESKLPGSAADARQAAGRSESDRHANAAPPELDEILTG